MITAAARQRLDKQRLERQLKHRQRVTSHMTHLADLVVQCTNAREMTYNMTNGCLQFRYSGRRVQYWVGTKTLVCMNAIGSTVYKEVEPHDFVAMLQDPNVNNVFKVEPRNG